MEDLPLEHAFNISFEQAESARAFETTNDVLVDEIMSEVLEDSLFCQKMSEEYSNHVAQAMRTLHTRNRLLATICGLSDHPEILRSIVQIQASMRGYLLRKDKEIFDKSVSTFISQCRMLVYRSRFVRLKYAIVRVQALCRGRAARNMPLGRAIRQLADQRQNIEDLEHIVLRMSSVPCRSLFTSQITIA
tara:strand:+ start:250 stop:819 length:570 start_codon:yes stop_codon:yes gene_type:complete